jgi:hypothetical protein
MASPSEFFGKRLGLLDVGVLRPLVTAAEENYEIRAPRRIVEPVTWPVVDAHLTDSAADGLRIARIAVFEPTDARNDAAFGAVVAQIRQPRCENDRAADFDPVSAFSYVAYKLHPAKARGQAGIRSRPIEAFAAAPRLTTFCENLSHESWK